MKATTRIETIAAEKLAAEAANYCHIPLHAVEDVHGVTPMQEALWTAGTQGGGAYSYELVFEVRKDAVARLKAAWKQLTEMTPMLRSCLVLLGPPTSQLLQVVVHSEYLAGDTEAEAGRSLARLGLAQLGTEPCHHPQPAADGHHTLSLRVHHALFDGWAMKLVLHGLRACYLGESVEAWPAFRRYVDYLEDVVAAGEDEARGFWRARLSGGVPTDVTHRAAADDRPSTDAKVSLVRDSPLVLPSSRGESGMITAATVVQTAWAVLAGAHAAAEDVLFATIVSGRDAPVPGVLVMPGPTMAAVPSRIRLDRDKSVCELLLQVALDAQAALPHQHSGLVRICGDYAGLPGGGRLHSLLVVQPPDADVVGFGVGPTAQSSASDWRVVGQVDDVHPYPLVVECWIPSGRSPGPVLLTAYFDSRLLSAAQARCLLDQLSDMIALVNTHLEKGSSTRVGDLEVVSSADLELLQRLNSTEPPAINRCLHDLFADSARSNPDALALDGWDMSLTYERLDRMSDKVAQNLMSFGVETETRVLTFFPKSAWAIVSLLAVSKAGGAFVPLEPAHPDRRLHSIAQCSGARVALAHPSLVKRLRHLLGSEVDVLDVQELIQTQAPRRNNRPVLPSTTSSGQKICPPTNLAYIIFTSGTTGAPKGVQIEHVSACSSITARMGSDAMNMTPSSRVLHFSTYCFDAFIDEVFMTLSCGGCVCIAPQDELRDDLCGVINRYGVTWAMLTPSVARILDAERVPTLQTLSLIGEAPLASDVAQWQGRVLRLLNGYGPTECAVICVVGDLLKDTVHQQTMYSCLGTPRGCRAWVVDSRNSHRLSPTGAAGELLIDGPNLGRGYLNNPEATADAWVDTPSSWTGVLVERQRRVYRTGDLVRMRPDGSLIYLGRKDTGSQAKIRGQRFEPSELENLVRCALPDIRQVAAVLFLRNGSQKDQALALTFVCEDGSATAARAFDEPKSKDENKQNCTPRALPLPRQLRERLLAVREALSVALPPYMVPTVWVPLQEMPLMPSTKTDREALTRLLAGLSGRQLVRDFSIENSSSSAHKTATTAVEGELVRLWASVLRMDPAQVGVTDDFLSLGGDSVKAMHLAGLCRSAGLRDVSTAAILRLRTIEALAKEVDAHDWEARRRGPAAGFSIRLPPSLSLTDQNSVSTSVLCDAAAILEVDKSFIQDIYPATPLQTALFTLGLLNKKAYRGLFVFDLPLHVEPATLGRAWAALRMATPAMRTRMFRRKSDILQAVMKEDCTPCPVVSTSLEVHLDQARQISGEMTFGSSLFSAHIVLDSSKVSRRCYLVLNVHHAVYDGWSIRILMEELERAYHDNAVVGREFVARNAYSRFVDYIVHMDADAHRSFWREYLAGSTFSEFPEVKGSLRPRTLPFSDTTTKVDFPLPNSEFTPSVVLYAAWSQLAAAYSGSNDIVFGITKHGRDVPAVPYSEDIFGPTIATLPLRVRIPLTNAPVSVRDFLQMVEDAAAATTRFEHYGLDNIRKSSPEAQSVCDFHSLIVVQTSVGSSKRRVHHGAPLGSREIDVGSDIHPFPLVLEATPILGAHKALHIAAHYDSSLLDDTTIRRLLGQLGHLVGELARLSGRPDAMLASLDLLSPADTSRIRRWNNDSALPPRVESCVHDTIAAWAETRPLETAVCGWDASFSYAQLHSLSSLLAGSLTRRGVRRGDFVPICLEKSAWAAVSQLAVLKAGGACVLIDPDYPKARNANIISQTQAKLIIVSNATSCLFSGSCITAVVATDLAEFKGGGPGELACPSSAGAAAGHVVSVRPQDPAYCVFTSGTTGSPKGIVIEHAALCTSAQNYGAVMGLGPLSRVLQFASCTFDVSVGEVLTTLMRGGCVCIPREDDKMTDLADCVNRFDANWLYLTSSVASLLKPEAVPRLGTLVVGGEDVQQYVIETWAGSHVTLINAYGPAETSIYCSSYVVPGRNTDARNIGKAVGCRMWIACAQDHQRLAPVGAIGEILIEGPILARGYLDHPEQTAAQFTAVRFLRGRRVYRSGDLALYDAQGNIHFRGRRDTQVKVNGQRLDVAEVETNIMQSLHGVEQAAVIAFQRRAPASGRTAIVELAAFMTFVGSATQYASMTTPTDEIKSKMCKIRKHLRNTLPKHMVPSVYMPVPALPRTTSLKLDRKELKRTVESFTDAELQVLSLSMPVTANEVCKPPRNDTEAELLLLFKQVLGYDEERSMSTDESFFDLGGNSLLLMQLLWLARTRGLQLSASDVYGHPTISALGHHVRLARDKNAVLPRATMAKETPEPFSLVTVDEWDAVVHEARHFGVSVQDVEDIYPATATQVGLMLQTEGQAGLWVTRDRWALPDDLDVTKFRMAWEAVVETSPVLRTRIVQAQVGSQSKAYQIVVRSRRGQVWEDDEHRDGSERPTMGFGTALSRHRLLPAAGHRGSKLFEWTRHHAVYDGWTTQLILRQLAHLCRGSVNPLETLPFAFYVRFLQNFDQQAAQAFWQSELANVGEEALSTCSFPRKQLSVVSGVHATLPAAGRCLKKQFNLPEFPGHSQSILVDDEMLPTVLEAAWALTISAYTGSQDVVVGLVRSGRTAHPSLVNVVGPTIHLVPRRFYLDHQLGVGAFLAGWRLRAQAAVPYEMTGYEVLRKMVPRGHASFNNLLVVQAGDPGTGEAGAVPAAVGLRPVAESDPSSTVGAVRYPYGMVLECVVQKSRGSGQKLELLAHHDEEQIEGGMVHRLLGHFEHVVTQLVRRPSDDTLLGDVSIMTTTQFRSQIPFLYERPPPAAVELCAHHLVARNWQAGSQNADRPAVCSGTGQGSSQHLTYRDLDTFSGILCHSLAGQEPRLVVGDDNDAHRFVAICMEKSIWTVVAMLAVWRAGGAVILLDANEPQQRLSTIVHRAKALLVLVSPATQHIWRGGSGDDPLSHVKTVLVDFSEDILSDRLEGDVNKTAAVPRTAVPGDACYCVFTSGSTAEPKGVVVQHRAICTSATHHGRATGLTHNSRVLQFASYSFDVSIDEILTTLAFGGCVCVVGEQDRRARLAEAMVEMRVGVALLTPAVLQTLEPGSVPRLETLVVGGSPLDPLLRARWRDRVDNLLVAYGPSECSVTATMTENASGETASGVVPGNIGRPVGCRAWVLCGPPSDGHRRRQHQLRLAPLGVVGELAIEGPILAAGYLGNEELTEERFIVASSVAAGFCEITGCPPQARLYLTGDLAKQNADGSLVFMGRRDNQVKVRGVRVELEAIEHCMLQGHPDGGLDAVQGAVVVLPLKGPVAGRLVGVLRLRNEEDTSTGSESATSPGPEDAIELLLDMRSAVVEDVKKRIEKQLPPSHIPTAWSTIRQMPLLPSGKINRVAICRQLEHLVTEDINSPLNDDSKQNVPDISSLSFEAKIRRLMAQVLETDLSSAPSSASFSRLGGDSLMAMQLIMRCRAADVAISLSMLLGDNSIAALAAAAEKEAERSTTASSGGPQPPLLKTARSQGRVDLSPAQRMFFSFYPFGPAYFNQSVAISVQHLDLAVEDLKRHLYGLVERHPALRSRFRRRRAAHRGSQGSWHWESVVTEDVQGSLRLRTHVVLDDRADDRGVARIAAETQQSLNITAGPLLAADVLLLPGGSVELLLVAHHLVVDTVSWSILLGDLEALLVGARLGPLSTPDPSVSLTTSPPGQGDRSTGRAVAKVIERESLDFWGLSDQSPAACSTSGSLLSPRRFSVSMGYAQTRALSDAIVAIDELNMGDVVEAVIVAVFTDFCRQKGRKSRPALYVEDHGRRHPVAAGQGGFSTTVGWLTKVWPCLPPESSHPYANMSLVEAVWHARHRRIQSRSVSQSGMMPQLPLELVLNYSGRRPMSGTGSPGPLKSASAGTAAALATVPDTDPFLTPMALIEVLASRSDGRLCLDVVCDGRLQHWKMVRSCVESCVQRLQDEAAPGLAALEGWRATLRPLPVLDAAQYETSQHRRRQLLRRLGLERLGDVESVLACSPSQIRILLAQARDPSSYRQLATWQVSVAGSSDHRPLLDVDRLHNACRTVVQHHPSLRIAFVQLPDMAHPVQVVRRNVDQDQVLRVVPIEDSGVKSTTMAKIELDINHASFDGTSAANLLQDIASAYSGDALPASSASALQGYLESIQVDGKDKSSFWTEHLQDVEPCRLPPLGVAANAVTTTSHSRVGPVLGFFDRRLNLNLHDWCREYGATAAVAIHLAWALALSCYTGSHDVCFGWMVAGRDAPVPGIDRAVGMFASLVVCRARTGPDVCLDEAAAAMVKAMAQELEHQHGSPHLLRSGQALFDTLVTVQTASSAAVGVGQSTTGGLLQFHQASGPDRTEFALVLNCAVDKGAVECKVTYDDLRVSEMASRAFFAAFEKALDGVIRAPAGRNTPVADLNLFHPLHGNIARDFNSHGLRSRAREGDGGGTPGPPPVLTIPALFGEQAHARPLAVAVDAWDARLTFAEIDRLSRSMCRRLVGMGLSRGQVVPLLCDKSAWVVVSLLAVSRAGAACAFLSPSDGILRLRRIMTETIGACAAAIVIASPHHHEKARALGVDCDKIVELCPGPDLFGNLPDLDKGCEGHDLNDDDDSRSADVAFIIFTSGSTGQPKGIRLSHSAFCLSALKYSRRLGISSQSRIFQFSAYTFDVGIGDMVVGLLTGATLCVPSEQDRVDDLNAAIERFRADVVLLTPSVAALLRPSRCTSLRTIALIGETPTAELYETWHGRVRMFNAWGPAECSVLASAHEVTSPGDDRGLIGGPVGCRLWLVDPVDASRLVPAGSVGEILVEGPLVALGYLNNPKRTEQAFLCGDRAPVDTKPHLPNARLYLTGDLARHVPGRGLVFVGRRDLQIKLRGQRVEVGEVEFHVRQRLRERLDAAAAGTSGGGRGVLAAVVVARQPSGEDALAAFVAPGGAAASESASARVCTMEQAVGAQIHDEQQLFADLAHQLRQDLSAYMVPSHYLPMRSLPQTPSGKLDRTRLREMANEWVRSANQENAGITTQTYVGRGCPATGSRRAIGQVDDASQILLRALWARILKVKKTSISPEDNFFNLGGDSILAMRLAAAALDEGIHLTVLTIMEFPELAAMAAKLPPRTRPREKHIGMLPPSPPASGKASDDAAVAAARVADPCIIDEFPATDLQEAMVSFNMSRQRGFLNYFILRLGSGVDTNRVEASCHSLMTQHAVLRSSFAYHDGRLYQRTHHGEQLAAAMVQRCKAHGEKDLDDCVSRIIDADREAPLEWGDCLTRFFIVCTTDVGGGGGSRLIVRLSHAVYDGLCLPTLWRDLSAGAQDGGEDLPPRSRSSFSQFALSVADLAQPTRRFWRHLLRGSHLTPVLPRPPRHNRSSPSLRPPTGLMEGRLVLTVSSKHLVLPCVTPATVLKAAWAVVMAAAAAADEDEGSYPSSPDVMFGHIVSGRETLPASTAPDGDDDDGAAVVVGAFLNCIPVRARLAPDGPARDLVRQVHTQHIAGLPYHGAGLQQLAAAGCFQPVGGGEKGREEKTGTTTTTTAIAAARFSTVVQYQNLPGLTRGAPAGVVASGPLAGARVDVVGRGGAYSDLWVTASPVAGAASTDLELRFDESAVEPGRAHGFLGALCAVLRGICQEEGGVLVSDLVEVACEALSRGSA